MVETSRGRAAGHVLEVAAFLAIVVADAYGLIPLTQTIALIPLVWIALRLRREPWRTIGLRRPENLGRAVVIGVVAGILMELLADYVTTPLISGFFGAAPDNSGLQGIEGNLSMLLIFLGLNWTLAAFGEEVSFRGFLLQRLARLFGDGQAAWWVALLLSSIVFGVGHTEQGPAGWVQEGLSGFLLGVLFLASGRSLAIPIIAHGVSNTLAFVLIYLGRYPGVHGA